MMLLGIETATDLVGVAIAGTDGARAGVWVRGGRRHAESLAPAIDHALGQAQSSLRELTAIAVDVGPGLFTGLRVGVATGQGLAQGLGLGMLGVTSVDILARQAYDAGWCGPVAAVVDARRGELFAAFYPSATAPGGAPARYRPDDLAAELATRPGTLAVGDGALRYAAALGDVRVAAIGEPSPRALVSLAADRLAAGAALVPPGDVRPVYLREADARINWVQR